MIGKVILMHQPRARQHGAAASQERVAHLRNSVFALTSYVVDANPHALMDLDGGILALTDYALAMHNMGAEPGEKVEAHGARNLAGNSLRAWQGQMLAVAARAPKMNAPVVHIILSLHESERWTEQQREEAITIVLQTLGLEDCQTVWAEHSNTRNPHVHLSVVRVDPATGKAAGSDWLIDDLHQALALVEERQGRVREPNALYVAREGVVYDRETGRAVRDASGLYVAGGKSPSANRERLPVNLQPFRDKVVAMSAEATTWEDFHDRLRTIGLAYDKAGSGARISVGDQSLKASAWHRSLARVELEKRLGTFTSDAAREDPDYTAYLKAVAAHAAALRQQRDADCERLDRWLKSSMTQLTSGERKAVAQAMRAEAAEARAAVRQAYSEAIAAQSRRKVPRAKWIQQGSLRCPQLADAPALILAGTTGGLERPWSVPERLFARHSAHATEYVDDEGRVQFTDHRLAIVVKASNEIAAVDAALKLAAERWGTISIRGSAQFCALSAERAKVLRIQVIDSRNVAPAPHQAAPIRTQEKAHGTSAAQALGLAPPAIRPQPAKSEANKPSLPEAQTTREHALAILSQFDSLPLKRHATKRASSAEGRNGRLTVNLDVVASKTTRGLLSTVVNMEADPKVQSALQAMRDRQLERWGRYLDKSAGATFDELTDNPVQRLPLSEQLAASSARADADWLTCLAEWRRREMAARDVAKLPPGNTSQKPTLDEEGLALYEHWLSQQRGGRGR